MTKEHPQKAAASYGNSYQDCFFGDCFIKTQVHVVKVDEGKEPKEAIAAKHCLSTGIAV